MGVQWVSLHLYTPYPLKYLTFTRLTWAVLPFKSRVNPLRMVKNPAVQNRVLRLAGVYFSFFFLPIVSSGAMLLLQVLCLSQTAAQSLQKSLEEIAAQHDLVGGALVVFCDTGTLHSHYFGQAILEENRLVGEHTLFRVASVSKLVTAVAIMQQVERNQLQLDSDISTVLGFPVRNPNFPAQPITPRMLLSHTSSFLDGPSYDSFLTATYQEFPVPSIREILLQTGRFYDDQLFQSVLPGSYFHYSNLNYVLLGTILEKITGERFDRYCQRHVFEPLKSRASFNVQELVEPENLAVLYRKNGQEWLPQVDYQIGLLKKDSTLISYVPGTNAGRLGPQGGMRISASDLAKFLQCLFASRPGGTSLLLPATVDQMVSEQWRFTGGNGNTQDGLFQSWGLGVHRINAPDGKDQVLPGSSRMIGHAGEAYGLVSDAYYDPERRVGLVFITNGAGAGYATGKNAAFYSVEEAVFKAIEAFGKLGSCTSAKE